MCYNKSTLQKAAELQRAFEFESKIGHKEIFNDNPNYNAVRLQQLPIIAQRDGELQAFKAMWWLIPSWAKSSKPEFPAFNARAETIDKLPSFSPYFKSSRCLIPVKAFYEYPPTEFVEIMRDGKKKKVKQPYLIRMKDDNAFMMAGIFSIWVNKQTGEELPTYAVITTEANKLMKPIHHRMPVILDNKHFKLWLDRDYKDAKALKKLLVPYPPAKMKAHKVSAEYLYDRTHIDKRCWKEIS